MAIFIVYDLFAYVLIILYTLYCICIGNFDTTTWPPLTDVAVPYDETTIYGWFLTLLVIYGNELSYLLCFISASTYFVSCCNYIGAICDHFNKLMHSIEIDVQQNQRKQMNQRRFDETKDSIITQFNKAIQIHVEIYE